MSILGLDNGYYYTKTSEDIIFISSYKEGKDIDINTDTIEVNIDNKNYVIGSKTGEFVADGNKVDSKVTELCTLTAIAKSFPSEKVIECNLVAGLPVQYYAAQKEDFKNKLISYGMRNVFTKINEDNYKKQTVRIKDVEVYPQSVGVVFMNAKNYKNETTLVIDIGGGTIDISYFEGLKMEDKATYDEGMLVLYTKLSQELKGTYDAKYTPYDMDRIIQKSSILTGKGKISTSALNPIIDKHVSDVATEIKRQFKYNVTDNILLIGGGSVRLEGNIKKHFKNAELVDNAQFINAKAFELMGQMKFR